MWTGISTMNNTAFAFVAAIAIGCFAASTADAMNIGSLSRQRPAIAGTEVASLAFPAVCQDLSCKVGDKKAADYAPMFHIVFASVGNFVRMHFDPAFPGGERAEVQMISVASAD